MLKRLQGGVCLLLLLCAGGCSVNSSPETPSWETEYNIPFGTETTTMSEWVDESDDLSGGEEDVISFQFEGTLDRAEIGDRLTVDAIETAHHPTIGTFHLDAPQREETELLFSEVWPPALALEGQTVPVPPFEFLGTEAPVPEMDAFHSMTLEDGALTVVVRNLLPVPIENVELALVDESTSTTIVSLDFASIPAMDVDSSSVDLSGKTLTNDLKIAASGGSSGSGTNPVYIGGQAGVTFEVGLSDLLATEASAQLPATDIGMEETAEIPEGMILTEAEVSQGEVEMRFGNDLPVAIGGTFAVAEFSTPSGAPFAVDVDIPAGGETTQRVSLDGYVFRGQPPPPGQPQELHISGDITTRETDDIVTIAAGDGLDVEVMFDTLSFLQVTGILDNTSFEITPTTEEVDVPDDLESISLQEARLVLKLVSNISVPVSLSLEAVGQSDKGTIVTLPIEADLAGGAKTMDTTYVVLDEDNSTIVEFLNNLPSTITISGEARAGDGVTEGTVSQEDFVEGSYEFEVPFHLAFEEQTIETDLTEIEILPESGEVDGDDDALDGEMTERMRSAEIWVTFVNHTPLGATLTANFAVDSTRVMSDPDLALGPVELGAGVVDESGNVVEATSCPIHLRLTEEDLALFRNPGAEIKTVYLGTEIRLHSTGDQAVKVRSSDYFQTQARIRFSALLEMPEDE
jgi:hypothetical protein